MALRTDLVMKKKIMRRHLEHGGECIYVNDSDICTRCRGLFKEGKESFREDIRPKVVNSHAVLDALRIQSWIP
jgi:hypothetical protein